MVLRAPVIVLVPEDLISGLSACVSVSQSECELHEGKDVSGPSHSPLQHTAQAHAPVAYPIPAWVLAYPQW